ncbi:fused MFS/spermidine synthase [Tunturiibacter lichenicola]|uniref:fused MFS/spermidine synthase n=1 Tax=Tunturiibacter lichenicola TaxID=2051959 RepID=UPI0021B3EC69|nr:fused MFS/spermidine synthase [Edaphobacter lichenicola]
MPAPRLFYGFTVFLGAFLLFLVEPMAAKQLLPALGGSSAVWLTALVFFQTTLLLGYLYAHWLTRTPAQSWRNHLYLASLAIAIVLVATQRLLPAKLSYSSDHPVTTIFVALTLTIGLPFLLLSSTSPLLQIWFLRANGGGTIPYRLFALSNAGSLLALIAYPFIVEPNLTLKLQRTLWSFGFVLYAGFCVVLARQARTTQQPDVSGIEPATPPTAALTKWLWFLLPMAAAMQLSAVTQHLTVNIAAIPLLWMLPLAAYLLTFILAFEFPSLYRRGIVVRLLVVMLAALGYAISKTDVSLPIGIAIIFFLAEAFLACLFCHAEACALRPQRSAETTLFYLLIAAGGAAGTFFIGILSPLIFSANYDLAISFFVTAALAVAVTWNDGWPQRLLWSTASALLLFFATMLHTAYGHDAILEVRNFYGTLRVKQLPTNHGDIERMLLNGTIQHGTQLFAPGLTRTPTTYYADDSGIGLALRNCCDDRPRNIGVIGLGTGTLATYGTARDHIRFYEINPLVRPIAQNLFTYLRDSPAQITFADGDARTSLTRESPQNFDVLAVDAFSGDAIPLHLLTTEAITLYKKHLAPNGILAFHVSNQYLNLPPEIAQLANAANMQSKLIESQPDESLGAFRSTWVLLTTNQTFFSRPEIANAATATPTDARLRPWTDDYSTILPILQLAHH